MTDPDEAACLSDIQQMLASVPKLVEHVTTDWDGWTLHPGSDLVGDDAATHPFEVSHMAHLAIAVAVDHLQAIAASFAVHQVGHDHQVDIHTHAQFTLLRAAMENSARAVWLLGPTLQLERIKRVLILNFDDAKNDMKMGDLLGDPSRAMAFEVRAKQIGALLTAAGGLAAQLTKVLRFPGYEEVVGDAGARTAIGDKDARLFWKICSALAHGDRFGTLTALEREVVSTDGDVATIQFTGSVKLLSVILSRTLAMTHIAIKLYEERATSPAAQ